MTTPTHEHDRSRVLNTLDFTSNKPSVVYSGEGNMKRAEKFASQNNMKTISQTEGGRYLESPNRFKEYGVAKARAMWAAGSQKFVQSIKGDVRTFVAGAKPNGVFREREAGVMVNNKDIGKVNGVDREKLKSVYDKSYDKAVGRGATHRDARAVASTQTYRATAVAELRQARRDAYQSADKKQIADYQKRKDAYLNQRVDDKKAMARMQGMPYKGPEKKTAEHRELDRKIGTRNMHARASLDKNVRDGHISKSDAADVKKGLEKNLSDFAKTDRSAFQSHEANRSFNQSSGGKGSASRSAAQSGDSGSGSRGGPSRGVS